MNDSKINRLQTKNLILDFISNFSWFRIRFLFNDRCDRMLGIETNLKSGHQSHRSSGVKNENHHKTNSEKNK